VCRRVDQYIRRYLRAFDFHLPVRNCRRELAGTTHCCRIWLYEIERTAFGGAEVAEFNRTAHVSAGPIRLLRGPAWRAIVAPTRPRRRSGGGYSIPALK
jgi:hypothetical protein